MVASALTLNLPLMADCEQRRFVCREVVAIFVDDDDRVIVTTLAAKVDTEYQIADLRSVGI